MDEQEFWVAELTDFFGNTLGGIYWDGHTRPGFDPVTTKDIYAAWKYRDAAACQRDIDKLAPCKAGVLRPIQHGWVGPIEKLPVQVYLPVHRTQVGGKHREEWWHCELQKRVAFTEADLFPFCVERTNEDYGSYIRWDFHLGACDVSKRLVLLKPYRIQASASHKLERGLECTGWKRILPGEVPVVKSNGN